MENKKLFLAIDAHAIIYRAYHAFPETLMTSEGVVVNAVFGFTSMLLKVLEEFDPEYVVCAFDVPKPTFRHIEFPEYKAHRKPTDQSLIDQFPLVEEVLEVLNIPIIRKEGFEADDILGTLARYVSTGPWVDYGLDMVIVTGDRDLLQLVGGPVEVCLPIGGFKNLEVFDSEKVLGKYGYKPSQVVDYKAMVGDASDNIPGIKGVGDKTALGLLGQYGDLDTIYKNLTDQKPRTQKLFGEGVEQAEVSKMLATIVQDVDVSVDLESSRMVDFDRAAVLELFNKFRFKSLVSKIPPSAGSGGKSSLRQAQGPDGVDTGQLGFPFDSVPRSARSSAQGTLVVDVKKVGCEELVGLSKKVVQARVVYVSDEESISDVGFVVVGLVDKSGELLGYELKDNLGCFIKDIKCETLFYNWELYVSQISNSLEDFGFENIFDVQLLSHLSSAGMKGYLFSDLVYEFIGENISEKLSISDAGSYLEMIGSLHKILLGKLKEISSDTDVAHSVSLINPELGYSEGDVSTSLNLMEAKTSYVLGVMENRGLLLDYKLLTEINNELSDDIENVSQDIYDSVGHEFNINSPKQLAVVLYDELGLPQGRGKSGRTTKEDVLKKMKILHPSISMILQYRELAKLNGTYVQPFINDVKPLVDKGELPVIKTDFNQLGASSGRFSSKNPNMQNLPARGIWASRFRKVFIPQKGMKLVSIDYSQIEFRVMTHLSKDPVLVDVFKNDRDIHLETAVRVFNKKPELITSDERTFGKTVNFGVLYGQTKYGLAGMLGVSNDEAEQYIKSYFENYKGVADYVSQATQFAQEYGYVQTFLGRRRYVAGLTSSNRFIRDAAIREAINMPVQGGAADVMKLAMLAVHDVIQDKYKESAYMLLQVHDELVFEVNEDVVDGFVKEVEGVMESVIDFEIPLKVSSSVGDNMSELK